MARGFNTYGVDSNDIVTTGLSTYTSPGKYSWFIRAWHDGNPTGLARAWDNAQTFFLLVFAGNTLRFGANFDGGTSGAWDWSPPGPQIWNNYGIRYDNSSTSNDPTVFQNGTKLTVGSGITETSTPTGTAVGSTTAYSLGN